MTFTPINVHKDGKVEGSGSDEFGKFKFEVTIDNSSFKGWKRYEGRNDRVYWKGSCSFCNEAKHQPHKLSKLEGHWGFSEGG